MPDRLGRGTDLFFPFEGQVRTTMRTANATIAGLCEGIKIIPAFFCQLGKKNVFFGVLQNLSH